MSEKPFLFITGSYNDLDNQAPIIWKMAKAGHPVRVIFLDRNANVNIDVDPRVRFLREQPLCRVDYFYALPESAVQLSNRPLLRSANPVAVKALRSFMGLMSRWVWTDAWAERVLRKMGPAVFAVNHLVHDHTLEGKLVRAAIRLGVPVLGVSHGPNVYGNPVRNVRSPRPFMHVQMTNPTQRGYTRVIASTPYERALWAEQGFEPMEKIVVYGAPRYCDEWDAITGAFYGSYTAKKNDAGKLKVLFFLPHWGAHVDQAKTLEGIERIAALDFVHLVVKEHTREGAGNLPQRLRDRFAASPNVEVIESAKAVSFKEWARAGFRTRNDFNLADSPALVKWADLAICFGSGIGVEVICRNKPLINPVYMYTFSSVYDVFGAGIVVRNSDELAEQLLVLRKNARVTYSVERFRQAVIYAEKGPHDVLESYRDLLLAIAGRRPEAKEAARKEPAWSSHG